MKSPFNFKIVGTDGNAWSLLGRFQKEALKNGWTAQEIKEVTNKAMSSDYDNLLSVLIEHTKGH